MAGTVLLVQAGRETSALVHDGVTQDGEQLVEEVAELEDALARLEQGRNGIDAVIVPPDVDEPVAVAQRVHSLDKDLAVLILCDPEREHQVMRAVQFAPFLGDDVTCRSTSRADALAADVADAAARTRRRRNHRKVVATAAGRLQTLPAAEPPVARYLGQLLDNAPLGVVAVDAKGIILGWNRRSGDIFGARERDMLGTPLSALFPDDARAALAGLVTTASSGRRPSQTAVVERTTAEGLRQFLEVTAARLEARTGEPGAMVLVQDVTERKRAEEAQRLIVEASTALVASLAHEPTVRSVARVAVPAFADWCIVDEVGDDGAITRVAVAAVDAEKEEVLQELQRLYPPDWASPQPAARALRAGESVIFSEFTDEVLAATVKDQRHLELIRRVAPKSAIAVPLTARGKTVGAITFASSESGRRYGTSDLVLAEEIARRAALAIDHARLYESERRARADAEAAQEGMTFLAEATAMLSASLDVSKTLASVARLAVPDLADWCVVYIAERDGSIRRLAVEHPDAGKKQALLRKLDGHALDPNAAEGVPRVIATGRPELRRDASAAMLAADVEDPDAFTRFVETLDITSWMCVPLSARGRTVGAISFITAESGRRYGPADLAFAEELATRAALAVDNAALFEAERQARAEAEQANERLRNLQAVSEAALAHLTLDDLLDELLARITDILSVDTAAILLADENSAALVPRAAKGLEEEVAGGVAIPIGKGFAGRVAAERRPVVIPDVDHADLFNPLLREKGLKSLLGVPLRVEREVIGVLHVGTLRPHVFTDEDARLLQLVADRVALAIENAALYEETERRAQAASVLEYVGDGVFLIDRNGVVQLWNPAAQAITGVAAEEVVGRRADEAIPGWETLSRLVPVGPERGRARPETVPLEIGEREVWLSISAVGFEKGTVYAFRDLSEERGLEQLKTELIGTVSHELRTPLAAVYGAAMTLRRYDLELDEDRRQRLLAMIGNESSRLARIVDDFLWASRLDSGSLHVSIESCDARAIAGDVVEAAKAHAPERISIEVVAPPSLPPVAADPDKVRQVLSNLVENAVKYSPDGGVVEVRLERLERRLRFSVRDEGLGIPPKEQQRIFEKFFRLDPNLTRGVGGTGLGLYICRELVRRMNGRVWVASKEGQGATFFVELPLADSLR